jgi:hypothetical protein
LRRSALRDQIAAASAAGVERERVVLPKSGLEVQLRGLLAGEVARAGKSDRKADVLIALAMEDPADNEPMFNANDRNDLDAIAAMSTVDHTIAVDVINRLSGIDMLGKYFSQKIKPGSSSSPATSEEPSPS